MTDQALVDLFRSTFAYNPVTGELTWQNPPSRSRAAAGSAAGRLFKGHLYKRLKLAQKTYYAHFVAFVMHHGRLPVGEIDHIDRDRLNNSAANLRECSRAENSWNTRGHIDSPTRKGVTLDKRRGTYFARIRCNGVTRHLGAFRTEAEAAEAYRVAELARGAE